MSEVMQKAEDVMRFADKAKTVTREHPFAMLGFESPPALDLGCED